MKIEKICSNCKHGHRFEEGFKGCPVFKDTMRYCMKRDENGHRGEDAWVYADDTCEDFKLDKHKS